MLPRFCIAAKRLTITLLAAMRSAPFHEVIDLAINQTLSRTILTSLTVFAVCFIMYVWGGPGIHPFNYAMLAGVFFGTYSSIAIASPLLLGFKELVATKAAATPATTT